jgi:hypothetical protein
VVVGAAVGALTAALAVAYVAKTAQVASARDDAEEATARADDLDRQVQKLIPFEQAEAQINAMRTAAQTALATDVDVPVFMDRITAQMPVDVGLTSYTFSISATSTAPGGAPAGAPLGTLSVGATGLSHDSTAHWITKMRELGILSDLWVPSSTKAAGPSGAVTFSSSANITQLAKSSRADLFKASPL